jgi:hypothetical protein
MLAPGTVQRWSRERASPGSELYEVGAARFDCKLKGRHGREQQPAAGRQAKVPPTFVVPARIGHDAGEVEPFVVLGPYDTPNRNCDTGGVPPSAGVTSK